MMSRLVSTVAARASRQARLLIAADLISRNCASFSRVARPVATFSVASALARLPLHSATTRHRFAPHCALQAQSRRFASASTASSPKTAPAPAAPPAPFATVVSSPIPVGADQALRITDSCVQRLIAMNAARKSTDAAGSVPLSLRLLVDAGGCSGFQYKLTIENAAATSSDIVFERDGARLLVDDLSFEHVRGATIDYVRELIRAAFVVAENPNAAEACGCKMSFSVKVS